MPHRRLRIASVPSGHPYVRHLSGPGEPGGLAGSVVDEVVRLPDPPVPGAPPGQWWPSPWLEADHVARHADHFDVLHLHFGFEHRSPDELRALASCLRRLRKPLVVTVHDLHNPHLADRAPHLARLDVLVPAADAVITLTAGAAAEIHRRWGVEATVIPHPHLVDLARMSAARPTHDGFVVGIHAKSERAGNASVAVARVVAEAVSVLEGASLRVDAHDDAGGRSVAASLAGLDVRVHGRFDDAELWDYLAGLDLAVLPYRFATHSGWLEACRDLGTTVLAPSCGYLSEQGPCLVYGHDGHGLDEGSLADGVELAWRTRPQLGADVDGRRRQRAGIDRSHRRVYAEAVERARSA